MIVSTRSNNRTVLIGLMLLAVLTNITSANATLVVPTTHQVNKSNADQFLLGVSIDGDLEACDGAREVVINFPEVYRGAQFYSVHMSIRKNGTLLAHASIVRLIDDERGKFRPFFGTSFCVDKSLLPSTSVDIVYKKGTFLIDILALTELDAWLD